MTGKAAPKVSPLTLEAVDRRLMELITQYRAVKEHSEALNVARQLPTTQQGANDEAFSKALNTLEGLGSQISALVAERTGMALRVHSMPIVRNLAEIGIGFEVELEIKVSGAVAGRG
jgi:hypothetical protein